MTQLKKNRIDEIQTLISAGLGSSRIAELKAEDWGISKRQVFKYIRDAKDETEEIENNNSSDEIVAIFDRFQEGNKFEVWLEAQELFEENPALLYDRPQEIERKAWGEFVKYGRGREERVSQILEGPKDATLIEPLDEYCESVRSGDIEVCKWVRLAVERHYRDLERQHDEDFPYYFEPAAAKHFVWFFKEVLPHYEGLFAEKPIEFEPWQWFGYGSLFGWYKKERFHDYPIRRFRTGTFIYPKKNGKSIISGGTGLYMHDYDYWPGAQCFILAKNQSHAKDLGYRAATKMVKGSELLSEKYRINRSAADAGIYFDGNNSFYKPITSKAESEDGRNVHFCGPDETKDWTDFDIYNLMEEGMVSAPNSLMMNTTTAGFDTESLGYEQQQYAENVLSGKVEDDTLFALLFTIDEEDKEKEDWWMDKALYKKANPNFGVSVFWETIQAKFSKAQASLGKRQSLITKHLNRWTSSNSAFVAEEKWDACGDGQIERFMERWEDVLDDYRGKVATGGLDLGGNSDFTSFELVFDGDVQDVLSFFWIPEDTIESRKNAGTVKGFVDQGYVFTTKGDWTDHDFVEECIKEIAEIVDLQEVVYDRYKMNQMVTHLENEGIEMTPFGQGYVSMSPAVEHLEDRILKGLINHFGNPILAWMNGNVSIKKDPAGNRKFDKDKSQDKIDGMVALAMALYRSSVNEDEEMDWQEVKFI